MSNHYPFINHPLPYTYHAMEPYIDEKTMRLHHDKHLQTYINNLNDTLGKYPDFQNWTLEQLIRNVPSLPRDIQRSVRNNGGGVYNHQFYFSNLTPSANQQPIGMLSEAVKQKFGSFASFQKQLKEAALSLTDSALSENSPD